MAEYDRYAASGEINSTVADQAAARSPQVARRVRRPDGVDVDELDGLTVALPRRLRGSTCAPSNTEPLLRLNVEAADADRDGRAARRGARDRPRVNAAQTSGNWQSLEATRDEGGPVAV